jgi:O-antigen ligase
LLDRARVVVAPLYLFACLVLGGSAQGIWQNMALQLAGLGLIAWAAGANSGSIAPPARHVLWIAMLGLAIIALQLIPLPASLWPGIGARSRIADGFRVLGLEVPDAPLSLTPYLTLNSMLGVIPPLAIYCAMVRLKAYRGEWIALALVAGTVAGILLGALQVASPSGSSPWYLYRDTNPGAAVGFFANANHMASLLVITIPFLAAIAATGKRGNVQRYSAIIALCVGSALVILVGLALNGSLAGYGLALPVLAASALILLGPGSRLRLWALVLAALLVATSVAVLETVPIGGTKFDQEASTSVQSRAEILETTSRALHDFMPFGTGLGSFRDVYHLYEKPSDVTTVYVVHVHNDYVEVALETGLAGVLVVFLLLSWWTLAVWRVWRTAEAGPFSRAASIASAAILIHSLVDFPLRTAAIAACFGMCLALLADRRTSPLKDPSDLRPPRHVKIGRRA